MDPWEARELWFTASVLLPVESGIKLTEFARASTVVNHQPKEPAMSTEPSLLAPSNR
ncbi:protein of unknown function [Methylocaldum szegediense]|uniref:Uncharacterized protein n=1 Tax=Methylocaldum szegediense TaxID=73780 RepID=A0ABM9I150_9GAMM|nr:protein of unknown function [Methylocaldum szegediense]